MKYGKFLLKRIIYMVVTLLITSMVIFFLLHVFGADPLMTILANKTVDDASKAVIIEKFNLDKPIIEQYFIWLKGFVVGDFGVSYISKVPVASEVTAKMPVTGALIVGTMLISFLISIPLGMYQASRAGRKSDQTINIVLILFASTPSFLLGLIAVIGSQYLMPGYAISGGYSNTMEFISRISVPCLVLSFINIGLITRLMRNSALDELNKSYHMALQAKGMPGNKIIIGNILPNSIIPVLTVASVMIGGIVSESMLVEQTFSLPGLGSMMVTSVSSNDFPTTMTITMILLIVFMISSLFVDILFTLIDPRIKL